MADRHIAAEAERSILAEPLTAAAFAPFGEVIAHRGKPGRCFIPAAFEAAEGVRSHLWVNRVAPVRDPPVPLQTLERHPFSAQNFLPLRGGRWLVVVAESDPSGRPLYDGIRAFATDAAQGVVYRPGTWHHGLLALDVAAEVAVVMGLTGRGDDTEFADLPWPAAVRLPPL